jgi:biopolymer transport protein ExbB
MRYIRSGAKVSWFLAGAHVILGAARADEAPPLALALPPDDLTPWSMFVSADNVVKGVMILLIVASVLSWTVALAKAFELVFARRKYAQQIRIIEASAAIADVVAALHGKGGLELDAIAAQAEIEASQNLEVNGVKERIASRLERLDVEAGRGMGQATGILATTGATAPFVGLFGTVWGVMNSFIGISKHHTTNLAVIAPGLAESLLTTALGLAAAIPAVVFYNMLARQISACRARRADGSAAVLRLAARDLDRSRALFKPVQLRSSAAE